MKYIQLPKGWVRRQWTSTILIAMGVVIVVAAFYQREGRDPFAAWALGVGALSVFVGSLHHRGVRGRVGAAGGIELDVPADRAARETTTSLAWQGPQLAAPTLRVDHADDVARWFIAETILSNVVRSSRPPIEDCLFQVFLYDSEEDALFPILDSGHHEGTVPFAVGQGAVGRAWLDERYVVAEGLAVADDTFGLSDEQKARYADLAVVAALPVGNAAGRPIAVLSASSHDPHSKLTRPEGFREHVFLGDLVSRILVDVLKWFDDEYDPVQQEG